MLPSGTPGDLRRSQVQRAILTQGEGGGQVWEEDVQQHHPQAADTAQADVHGVTRLQQVMHGLTHSHERQCPLLRLCPPGLPTALARLPLFPWSCKVAPLFRNLRKKQQPISFLQKHTFDVGDLRLKVSECFVERSDTLFHSGILMQNLKRVPCCTFCNECIWSSVFRGLFFKHNFNRQHRENILNARKLHV